MTVTTQCNSDLSVLNTAQEFNYHSVAVNTAELNVKAHYKWSTMEIIVRIDELSDPNIN